MGAGPERDPCGRTLRWGSRPLRAQNLGTARVVRNSGVGRLAEGGAMRTAAGEAESTRRGQGSGNSGRPARTGRWCQYTWAGGWGRKARGRPGANERGAHRGGAGYNRAGPAFARREACAELERVRLCALGGVRAAHRRA